MTERSADAPAVPDVERLLGRTSWLRALARSLVGDGDADDLCQDAALAALARPPRQRGGIHGWLATVLRRLAAQRHRSDRRRVVREARAARGESVPSTADVVAGVGLQREVVDAVLALPEPYRSTLLLRFWEDLPPQRIARAANVPVETVRTRIKRGLAMVRARLDAARGGRAAWAAPLLAFSGSRVAAGAAFAGVTWMGMQGKALVGIAAVLAVVVGAWWQWPVALSPAVGGAPLEPTLLRAEVGEAGTRPAARTVVAPLLGASSADRVPLLTLTGTVVDEVTLAPLADAQLSLNSGLRQFTSKGETLASSASDGTFRIAIDDEFGAQHPVLWVRASGRAAVKPNIPSIPGEAPGPRSVDLGRVLVPPGTGLRGRVQDARGVPVADAHVLLSMGDWRPTSTSPPSCVLTNLLPLGRTDAAGEFLAADRVIPFSLDTFVVAVCARGAGYVAIQPTRARNDLDVVISLTETARVDVTVRDPQTGAVAGARVRGEPKCPPLGAAVPGYVMMGVHPVVGALFSTTTDADGRASLPCLPLGVAGAAGARSYDVVVVTPADRTFRRPVQLDPRRPLEVTIEVGGARLARVFGSVRDTAGEPIAGARVSLDGHATTTGDDGRYELTSPRVIEARLLFQVVADGYLPAIEIQPVPAGEECTFDFTLTSAAALWGTVVDERGVAVPGASVFVAGAERAHTDATGSFRVEKVTANGARLRVMPPEPRSEWADSDDRVVCATDCPVRWVLTRLPPGTATITIEVVDAATGAPADAAGSLHPVTMDGPLSVMAGPWLTAQETRIGVRRYEGVRPGTYKLTVGKRYERILRVAPGDGNVLVRVELRQPGTVRGELVLDHVPPENWPARVSLYLGPTSAAGRFQRPAGGRLLETQGLATGAELVPALGTRFVIEDVDPYQPVSVVAFGGELHGRAWIEVPSDGEAVLRLRLDVTGRVAIVFAQPAPVERLELQLRVAEASTWDAPRHLVVARGASSLGGTVPVLPGRYRWQVSWQVEGSESPHAVEGEVEIVARQTAELAVDFERGQPIRR